MIFLEKTNNRENRFLEILSDPAATKRFFLHRIGMDFETSISVRFPKFFSFFLKANISNL